MVTGPGTILGGLPVIVDISSGYDSYCGEYWAEVDTIYWRKRDGSKGKEISQHLYDRAEKYDSYFSNLIDAVFDDLAREEYERGESLRAT